VLSDQAACEFVIENLYRNDGDIKATLDALTSHAIHGLGSDDNVTAVLVFLRPWPADVGVEWMIEAAADPVEELAAYQGVQGEPLSTQYPQEIDATAYIKSWPDSLEETKRGPARASSVAVSDLQSMIQGVLCDDKVRETAAAGVDGCIRALRRLQAAHGDVKGAKSSKLDALLLPHFATVVVQACARRRIARSRLATIPRKQVNAEEVVAVVVVKGTHETPPQPLLRSPYFYMHACACYRRARSLTSEHVAHRRNSGWTSR
jgi:hypothetical protein